MPSYEVEAVGPEVSWQRWPLAEGGAKAILKAVLALAVAATVWVVLLYSLPGIAAVFLGGLFSALLLPYFLPATYKVGPKGVKIERAGGIGLKKEWSDFSDLRQAKEGFWLVPVDKNLKKLPPSFQPPPSLRAIFLPFPINPLLKEALDERLRYYLQKTKL